MQESFITIYSMECRKPFSTIPEELFREILTYVDLQECHDLKMRKVFDQEVGFYKLFLPYVHLILLRHVSAYIGCEVLVFFWQSCA